jgi:hypothetical protein
MAFMESIVAVTSNCAAGQSCQQRQRLGEVHILLEDELDQNQSQQYHGMNK